jgi:hypothetical protein
MKVPILSIEALDRGFLLQFGETHLACTTFEEALAHVLQEIAAQQPQNQVMQGTPPPAGSNVSLFPGLTQQPPETLPDVGHPTLEDEDDEEVRYGVGPDRSQDLDDDGDQEVRGGGALDIGKQMRNLETLNRAFAAGKTKSGLDFGPNEWSKGLDKFCPDLDPAQAEYLRGQYIAQQREGSDWE